MTAAKQMPHASTLGLSLLAIILLVAGSLYWRHTQRYPSTDDAYVQAHIVHIAPEISGKLEKVFVENNQTVARETVLLQIEQHDYQLTLDAAHATLQLAQQQWEANTHRVASAEADVLKQQAELKNALQDHQRLAKLLQDDLISDAEADAARTRLAVAQAALDSSTESLATAKAQLGSPAVESNAAILQAKTALAQAERHLQQTLIASPVNGVVSNLSIRPGDHVQASEKIFALIDETEWWINANFKETQLSRIQVGQTARVSLDIYPDRTFSGKVVSISKGSGNTFSLLPAENATGNWVKITQRFQVKIALPTAANEQQPLRVGASATVVIDTLS